MREASKLSVPGKIEIDVTAEDIDKGKRRCIHRCPIARAVSRVLDTHERNVSVAEREVTVTAGLVINEYLMSERAAIFIEDFDAGRPVEPFKGAAYLSRVEEWSNPRYASVLYDAEKDVNEGVEIV